MSNKILGAALVVVAIIAIGAYKFPQVQQGVQNFGARPGPDTDSQCTTQNGLITCSTRKPLTTATTTPCSIKSPTSTSTLAESSTMITVASSTATTWTLAKATTAFATTTYLDTFSLGSGAQGTMYSIATTTGLDIKQTIAPNTWLVWGMAGIGTSYDASKLAGYCSASFNVQ